MKLGIILETKEHEKAWLVVPVSGFGKKEVRTLVLFLQ